MGALDTQDCVHPHGQLRQRPRRLSCRQKCFRLRANRITFRSVSTCMAARQKKTDESEAPARVFISATSKDLGTVRELVKQALLTMGCMPIEQSDFPPDYRTVHEMIEHKIAGCEAVIHIVGCRFGAGPDPATLPEGAARRSYTQMEADIARQLGKKLYLFVCPEDFPYDQGPPENEELQQLQRDYRAEISKSKTIRTKVANREELSRKVRELQFELERLKSTMGRHRRRVMALLAVLVIALGGIGAGVWWWLPTVVKKEISYDQNKAREELATEIRRNAQRKIEEAGNDWRKAMEVEKWRDQQLADLDRFLERIQETFDAGDATESYRKATDLLTAKGPGEALAYLQARSAQRQSLIEMQASRRDREETELRKLLQEELLAASLLENNSEFDAAEAKYRQVVEKSGTWAKGRNDFAWFLIQRGRDMEPDLGKAKFSEAAEVCRATASLVSRDKTPEDWATTQSTLGIALQEIGTRLGGEEAKRYLEQAVAAQRSALEVRTRQQLPEQWARTQNNLGGALRELGTRSGGEEGRKYLEEAFVAYRSALEFYSRESLRALAGNRGSLLRRSPLAEVKRDMTRYNLAKTQAALQENSR